ncbi:MAG TPA: hypothetical protein VHC97_04735 [Thermoanaerobaculia bacterium]|nr:hypothetical protein [Thermoanaerobaculia bacterium]
MREAVSRGAILLFLVLAAHQAAKPLHLDDMDFPAVAEATARSGKPIYYRGEENRAHSGLYHPPLYIYTLAGWFRLFGSGPAQARMFGALCALLQGWLALRILGRLFGEERVRRWRWLFWLAFLLNPYTLQVSAIPDIDSTVYGPLLTLVLWSVIRIGWRDGRWREDIPRFWEPALVALALTGALWAKLTTVFLLFPFLFLFLAPLLGWKKAVLVTAGVSAAGLAGFLSTYWLYGALTGLDVVYTFQFLRASMLGPGRLLNYRANFTFMVPFTLRWTGLLPWLSALALLAAAARRWWRDRERRALYYFFLLGLSVFSVIYYCGQVMSFAGAPFKYTFVFWALLTSAPVLLVAVPWERGTARAGTGRLAAGAGVWLAGLWIGGAAVRDALLKGGMVYPRALSLWIPAGVAAAGLIAWAAGGPRLKRAGADLAACALLLHAGLQAGTALHQSRVEYSTTYNYGQRGLREAAAFLWAHTSEQEIITSMKDVGFLAKRRYVENYAALYDDASAARLIAAWESGRVSYIVFTEGNGPDQLAFRPVLRDWIAGNADLVASFGDYRIYRPKSRKV